MPRNDKSESKRSYLAKRRARVRELYVRQHMEPRDIAAKLVREGTIETTDETLESAVRLVREDVRAIRAELEAYRAGDAEAALALGDVDAMELELAHLREECERQKIIAAGEPTEMCARSRLPLPQCVDAACHALGGQHAVFVGPAIGVTYTDTPQGLMTSYHALWPAGVRQKASKDAATLAQKISKLEVALAEKRLAERQRAEGSGVDLGGLTIIESEKTIPELIEQNLNVN